MKTIIKKWTGVGGRHARMFQHTGLKNEDTKEYKGRTDSNSPTKPNEAVCLATILL